MALEFRDRQLAAPADPDFRYAQEQWQGNHVLMQGFLNKLVEEGGDNDEYIDVVYNVALLWKKLKTAPELPVGTVLWHASESEAEPNTDVWLPTSATFEGAQIWASQNIQADLRVYHRLEIVQPGVRALAIGASPEYEHEKELLLMPRVIIDQTLNGNVMGNRVTHNRVTPP